MMTATLGWVFTRWREKKTESKPSFLKRYSRHKHATVHCRVCVLFCLCRIRADFYLYNTRHGIFTSLGTSTKRTKQNKMHTQHTHTTQNRIVLLCFAFSLTQIAAIISLALQAFSFILKAVFGIALHLTQFNK